LPLGTVCEWSWLHPVDAVVLVLLKKLSQEFSLLGIHSNA